jgi:sec-independent protein translocase protein TatB
MFNLDPGKLLVIGVVAILVLGPDKLPVAARRVGATWTSFNEFRQRMESEVRQSIPDLPSTDELVRLARSPAALLSHLSETGTETVAPADAEADGAAVAATNPEPPPGSASFGRRPVVPDTPAVALATVPGDANLN